MATSNGAEKQNPNHNYIGANDPHLAELLSERTVENSVPYILPVLNNLPSNFTLLDVGCGPGSITVDIARRYPSATILALDGGPEAIEAARENAKRAGVTNIKFVVGDALDIAAIASQPGFEAVKGGCDVVHSHQIHMHVQDAPRLMREMRAAAKPRGGYVCCRESDMGLGAMWPPQPMIENFMAAVPQMMQARGQDPFVGRKLVSHALAAGFKRKNIEASLGGWLMSTPEERQAWARLMTGSLDRNEGLANKVREEAEKNVSHKIEIDQLKNAWKSWVDAEDGWYALPTPQVVCMRED